MFPNMEHITAAIYYAPDGYNIERENLMGRASAGHGLLRAASLAHADKPIYAYTTSEKFAQNFGKVVKEFCPTAQPLWLQPSHLQKLSEIGTLYRPDTVLSMEANYRLRAGSNAYSICGVAHTISTHRPMEAITEYLTAPLFPWDAMICTSRAVKAAADYLLEQQYSYMQWRFGLQNKPATLQLPIIPLGVHCDQFAFTPEQKQAARAALGIADNVVVCLFVGRLTFYEKAHPMAMYQAVEAVATSTGTPIVMLECGWTANAHIENAYHVARATCMQSAQAMSVDGRDAGKRNAAWAAADIFISLSDNIQETFGLTPIEAMAAGLPVIATDWDGYRDTVRHNVDGFLIPTLTPQPEIVEDLAAHFESTADGYGVYCGKASALTSVDHEALFGALKLLVMDSNLRKRLGDAGRARAREVFDWPVIFRAYQGLWHELKAIRQREAKSFKRYAAGFAPAKPNPFRVFANYPSKMLKSNDRVILGSFTADVGVTMQQPMQNFMGDFLPSPDTCKALLAYVSQAKPSAAVEDICKHMTMEPRHTHRAISWLLKMDYLRLHRVP